MRSACAASRIPTTSRSTSSTREELRAGERDSLPAREALPPQGRLASSGPTSPSRSCAATTARPRTSSRTSRTSPRSKEAALLFAATFEHSVVPMLVADDGRQPRRRERGGGRSCSAFPHDEALWRCASTTCCPTSPSPSCGRASSSGGTIEARGELQRPGRRHERQIEFVATANVRPGRHIAVVRDLTQQKELEAQLRQAQKMEAVGRLAGGIAHDFNNLLTAISGLQRVPDRRARRRAAAASCADEIRKAAARAASLTGQLLAFSRRQVLQPRVLDLNAVVSDMDMMLRRLIGEDVELVTLLDRELVRLCSADPTQIEQVIVNLAVNARDAMPHGGSLTIETANVVDRRRALRRAAHDRHRRRHDRRRARSSSSTRSSRRRKAARASASRPSTGSSSRAAARSRSSRRPGIGLVVPHLPAARSSTPAERVATPAPIAAPRRARRPRRSCSSRTRRSCASSSRRSSRRAATPCCRRATGRRRSSCCAATASRSTCSSPTSSCPG